LPPNCAGQGYEGAPKAATTCSTWKRSRVCIDQVRELSEHDAWLAALSGRREPAMGAVGRHGVLLPGMPAELPPPGLDVHSAFTPESQDCVIGTCPKHRHLLR
jgi:hypothetical protein